MKVWNWSSIEKPWMGLVAVLAILIFVFSPRFTASHPFSSSLSGLATLQHLSRTAIDYDLALSNGKPTLVEFYATWCQTCQHMAPILQHLEAEYGDHINLVLLDIDDPQWSDLTQDYQIRGVPTFLVLNSNHEVTRVLSGSVPLQRFRQYLQE
ncbi:MAG: thioredoxin fold domain-containing protein [Synechococcaceae cyanobacterium SM2_3_1]|nr:thioredoxin fold domain-containing protein [Synechococcaceae cyanobacterium SM2_3_1]